MAKDPLFCPAVLSEYLKNFSLTNLKNFVIIILQSNKGEIKNEGEFYL